MIDRERYEEAMATILEQTRAGLKRRREVLRLERAIGSSATEASAAACRAFMLHLHETYDQSPAAE